MNPVYKIISSLPTNGWTTAIGAVGLIAFGVGGLVTNKIDSQTSIEAILAGLTALGLGNKLEKMKKVLSGN